MVVLLVAAGTELPDAAPVVTALGAISTDEVLATTDGSLLDVLTDDVLGSLEAVVVLAGAHTEAGHRACQAVRAVSQVPICMVCTSGREAEEVVAFANGCDDFIRLPRSPAVLRARLGSLVARGRGDRGRVMTFGCLCVDPRLRTATVRGEPVDLTRTEFDIVATLLANQRRVVSRHELLQSAWGACPAHEHALDVHMSRLRSKILAAGGPKLGDPVAGVGYRVGRTTCSPSEYRPFGHAARP